MDRYERRIEKLEPTDRGRSAAATPAETQAKGSPASRRKNRARPGESAGPKKAQAAQAAQFPNASRVSPATPRLSMPDEEQFIVESFVIGVCGCPEKYHDAFIDSWMHSHPAGRSLLFAAYITIDIVEKFDRERRVIAGRS